MIATLHDYARCTRALGLDPNDYPLPQQSLPGWHHVEMLQDRTHWRLSHCMQQLVTDTLGDRDRHLGDALEVLEEQGVLRERLELALRFGPGDVMVVARDKIVFASRDKSVVETALADSRFRNVVPGKVWCDDRLVIWASRDMNAFRNPATTRTGHTIEMEFIRGRFIFSSGEMTIGDLPIAAVWCYGSE